MSLDVLPARRVVLAMVGLDLVSVALALAGVGGNIPPRPYVIVDVATEVVLLVGLWFFSRVAWWLTAVLTAFGEVLGAAHATERLTANRLVLLVLGLFSLVLLMAPSLRRAVRPISSDRPAQGASWEC